MIVELSLVFLILPKQHATCHFTSLMHGVRRVPSPVFSSGYRHAHSFSVFHLLPRRSIGRFISGTRIVFACVDVVACTAAPAAFEISFAFLLPLPLHSKPSVTKTSRKPRFTVANAPPVSSRTSARLLLLPQ